MEGGEDEINNAGEEEINNDADQTANNHLQLHDATLNNSEILDESVMSKTPRE